MRYVRLAGYAPVLHAAPDLRALTGSAIVDMSDLEFASPLDLVAIATLIASAPPGAKVRVVPPADPAVANYLLRMDLLKPFDGQVLVDPPFEPETPRDQSPAIIELTCVRDAADIDLISPRVFQILERVLPPEACAKAFQIIEELLDNATTHGRCASGAFLAAQYYTGVTSDMPPGFWIGVADSGIGIRRHLANNPEYRHLSDVAAIRLASHPRVSGTADTSRGWGLPSVRGAAGRIGPGRVVIRSGGAEGWYFVGPGGNTARYRLRSRVTGTWVLALAGQQELPKLET